MRLSRVAVTLTAVCVLVAGFAMGARAAADFPKRPVTFVIPWGAGGGSDIVGRALARPLEKELGQPVIVVNKPGGAGTVGTSYLAHSRADGYTIGVINNAQIVHQYYYGGLDYKPEDLEFLCAVLRPPVFLSVNKDSPIKNLDDFIKTAKEKNGTLNVGVPSIGGSTHLPVEEFFGKANLKTQLLPMPGGGSGVVVAIVGGHIDSAANHPSEIIGQVKAGNIRPLAVSEAQRLPEFPDVPTFRELGYDVVGYTTRAVMLPKGVPADVKAVLVKALERAAQDPTYLETITKLGETPIFMGPEEAYTSYKDEDARLRPLIERLGLMDKNVKK